MQTMSNFTPQALSDICRTYGPKITPLPDGVDGTQLLWAISGNESSFGKNCQPRHEPAFDVGGLYGGNAIQVALLKQWGSIAASSLGPWQLMFVNAPEGYKPTDFNDLTLAAVATVRWLNQDLRTQNPRSLAEIGSIYNAGHVQVPFSSVVLAYTLRLATNYKIPLMEPAP